MFASLLALTFSCALLVTSVIALVIGDRATGYAALYKRFVGTASSSPASGPGHAIIAVSGSGWQTTPDGTTVTFGYSSGPACATMTSVGDSQPGTMRSGAFSGWFRWPLGKMPATYTVCASIGGTVPTAAGSYTLLTSGQPELSISAHNFLVGQNALVTGSNYLPGGISVPLVLQGSNGSNATYLGNVTSDASGAFSLTFVVPNKPTGSAVIVANYGSGSPPTLSASVSFTVQPVVGPTPSPGVSPTPTPTATTSTNINAATPDATQNAGNGQTSTPVPDSNQHPITTPSDQPDILPLVVMVVVAILVATFLGVGVIVRRRRATPDPAFNALSPRNNGSSGQPLNGVGSVSAAPWVSSQGMVGNAPSPWLSFVAPSVQAQPSQGSFSESSVPPTPAQPVPASESAPLPLDPSLEAVMRQAQSGLFVLPERRGR